jgi:hypothetical protein
LNTVGELDGEKDWMFDFMSDVGGSEVVVETFRIVFDHNLALSFGLKRVKALADTKSFWINSK